MTPVSHILKNHLISEGLVNEGVFDQTHLNQFLSELKIALLAETFESSKSPVRDMISVLGREFDSAFKKVFFPAYPAFKEQYGGPNFAVKGVATDDVVVNSMPFAKKIGTDETFLFMLGADFNFGTFTTPDDPNEKNGFFFGFGLALKIPENAPPMAIFSMAAGGPKGLDMFIGQSEAMKRSLVENWSEYTVPSFLYVVRHEATHLLQATKDKSIYDSNKDLPPKTKRKREIMGKKYGMGGKYYFNDEHEIGAYAAQIASMLVDGGYSIEDLKDQKKMDEFLKYNLTDAADRFKKAYFEFDGVPEETAKKFWKYVYLYMSKVKNKEPGAIQKT